ncbi:hypothetical protein K1X76_02275 [bacterium]|nr:hypothetical protein [bacterium]
MSLEKLGLLFLLNYFNQLGTVKNHLLLALREVLLAMNASVEIVAQTANPRIKGTGLDVFQPLVKQAQGVINYTIDKITPPDSQLEEGKAPSETHLKEHIVDSIISAIDDEIENTSELTNQKSRLKVEALQTVKEVLLSQLKQAQAKARTTTVTKARTHVA